MENAAPYHNEDGSYTFPASPWCVLVRSAFTPA